MFPRFLKQFTLVLFDAVHKPVLFAVVIDGRGAIAHKLSLATHITLLEVNRQDLTHVPFMYFGVLEKLGVNYVLRVTVRLLNIEDFCR